MPAKRKAAVKAVPVESSRPSRSSAAKAGSKRKGSPSPATTAVKKGVGARKGTSESDTSASNRQSARGRSASKQKEEPTSRAAASRSSHATRAAVEEVETKKAATRGRSKTPSTPQKTKPAPRSKSETPKQKQETPKQKAATPRQRSATPKSKPATPKQKAVTPKAKPKSPSNTPKQKATAKQQTQKEKQKSSPVKTDSRKTPQKKQESPKKGATKPKNEKENKDQVSPKKSPRKAPARRETPPSKPPARSSSRGRGKVAADSEKEENKEEQQDTEKKDEVSATANMETEQTNDNLDQEEEKVEENSQSEDVHEKEEEEEEKEAEEEEKKEQEVNENKTEQGKSDDNIDEQVEKTELEDESEQGDKNQEEDRSEAMEVEGVVNEDENVEQDQDNADKPEEKPEQQVEEQKDEAQLLEDIESVPEKQPEEIGIEEEPDEPIEKESGEDLKESQAESEQVESEDKECESAESEQVEADAPVTIPEKSEAEAIVINDDSEDSSQPDVISDVSDNNGDKVIELNDDSGDAVIVLDSKEIGSGDQSQETSKAQEEAINPEVEPSVAELDDTGVEIANEAVENDVPSSSDQDGNADSEGKKRKIDEVEDAEDSGEFSKKSKTTEGENILENGTVSQEEENVYEDYVVIEMNDVPPSDSNEVKESIPKDLVSNSVEIDSNPVFNREFIPNPAFSGSGDISKQFSVVSYNILADCHLFRNDYSFTEKKYLVPEYRLEKIIEELKYLDGDIICMQEVDPSFFSEKLLPSLQSIGYEGFHKKRTTDFYNEGEATFYKTGRFSIVECQLHRQADLVEKVLSEGSVDQSVQDAVRKYMDLPDVLVVTKLRCNNTGSEITIGNVHINWGEMKTPDIQCVQIASAVKETVVRAGSDNVPHIICGDFNSPPLSPGYLVARDGYPSGDETITKLQQITSLELPEGKMDSLVNCLWPAFQHTSSSLKSAYCEVQGKESDVTSFNQVMCDCVDYIFYSSTSIDNVGVYRVPSKEKIMETGGTPNLFFPSDHVSVKAVLSFK